jgi:nucleoside 2-deoxyribosyltransferase
MIIHLITHFELPNKNADDLNAVFNAIQSEGHTLAHDWIGLERAHEAQKGQDGRVKLNWQRIYHDSINAIERSDVVIAESSGFGCFGVGYQAALALQKKKPLLILRHSSMVPEQGAFTEGIDDPLVQTVDYDNRDELLKIVKDFLIENSNAQKDLRFNFVIDRQIHNHLKWRSFKTGKTKAEVVRDLLQKDMQNGQD